MLLISYLDRIIGVVFNYSSFTYFEDIFSQVSLQLSPQVRSLSQHILMPTSDQSESYRKYDLIINTFQTIYSLHGSYNRNKMIEYWCSWISCSFLHLEPHHMQVVITFTTELCQTSNLISESPSTEKLIKTLLEKLKTLEYVFSQGMNQTRLHPIKDSIADFQIVTVAASHRKNQFSYFFDLAYLSKLFVARSQSENNKSISLDKFVHLYRAICQFRFCILSNKQNPKIWLMDSFSLNMQLDEEEDYDINHEVNQNTAYCIDDLSPFWIIPSSYNDNFTNKTKFSNVKRAKDCLR